jgi:mycothiol synthase
MISNSNYNIRNYRTDDLQACVQLWLIEGQNQTGGYISPQIAEAQFDKPGFPPEKTVLVAEKGADIIGCLNITPELESKRAVIHCTVHPKHRRHGVATTLFDEAAKRMTDIGARVAATDILTNNTAAKNLLTKLGFKAVRDFVEMQQILDSKPADTIDTGFTIRHLNAGEEDVLTNLQNHAFTQHWGFNPNTIEQITHWLSQNDSSHEHVILACDGNIPIGYCWTTTIPEINSATGKKHGRIHMLGVHADYRGKGIGRAVLLSGMAFLYDKAIEVVEITADSDNKLAIALYESVGFKLRAISQCYEKGLD